MRGLKPRILIADDAAFMRTKIRLTLEKAGYDVVGEAEDGMDAIALYQKLQPDLVTLDITMPVLDGIEALRRIIKFDQNAKVLMVSAMGQEEFVKEAVLAGAKTFLVKPFSDDRLIKTIEKILSI